MYVAIFLLTPLGADYRLPLWYCCRERADWFASAAHNKTYPWRRLFVFSEALLFFTGDPTPPRGRVNWCAGTPQHCRVQCCGVPGPANPIGFHNYSPQQDFALRSPAPGVDRVWGSANRLRLNGTEPPLEKRVRRPMVASNVCMVQECFST
jgi:hypothetical protein